MELGKQDFLERVILQPMADGQELVESPKRREMEADGCPRQLLLSALKEVAAKVIGREIVPRRKPRRLPELLKGVPIVRQGARRDVALNLEMLKKTVCDAITLRSFQSRARLVDRGAIDQRAYFFPMRGDKLDG